MSIIASRLILPPLITFSTWTVRRQFWGPEASGWAATVVPTQTASATWTALAKEGPGWHEAHAGRAQLNRIAAATSATREERFKELETGLVLAIDPSHTLEVVGLRTVAVESGLGINEYQ